MQSKLREKFAAQKQVVEAYLQRHLLAFQIVLVIMASIVPLIVGLGLKNIRLPHFLEPGFWLWAGWYGVVLMMYYWRWWKRMVMQILMIILVPLNMFIIVGVFITSTMGGIVGIAYYIFMLFVPIGPILAIVSLG